MLRLKKKDFIRGNQLAFASVTGRSAVVSATSRIRKFVRDSGR
jgi:hypothetical protein